MYQRLLLMFSTLLITGSAMCQDVMTPTDGCPKYDPLADLGTLTNPKVPGHDSIAKWVHDPSQNGRGNDSIGSGGFDQSTFKCYFYKGTAFRIRFPNNYNPLNKYQSVMFLHGAGEASHLPNPGQPGNPYNHNTGANRENQDQLYWGAKDFEQRMNQGLWNGFMIFPQLVQNSSEWQGATLPPAIELLDSLAKYNGLDADRVTVMGLSAGGLGVLFAVENFPKSIAGGVSSTPETPSIGNINAMREIPLWIGAGGVDGPGTGGPDISTVVALRDNIDSYGGNAYLTISPSQAHSPMWTTQWNQRDIYGNYLLIPFWFNAHKAEPQLYGTNNTQKNVFCTTETISAPMGITAGFAAYEWQVDNGSGFANIPGATTNAYTAQAAGMYRVHFKRTAASDWSAWSPTPIAIISKTCAPASDTAYVEHFDRPLNYTASLNYKPNQCLNGIAAEGVDGPGTVSGFSQDAAGRIGGRFLIENTYNCTFNANDEVWRNYLDPVSVVPGTNYILNVSMANHFNYFTFSSPPALSAALSPAINGISLAPVGGVRAKGYGSLNWKKLTYLWNSGSGATPSLSIFNNTPGNNYNDFAIDEISLVKYNGAPFIAPGGKNASLWVKAGSIPGGNNASAPIWPNSQPNGDNLSQSLAGLSPILKNNPADNLNFNPVVSFSNANNQYQQLVTGFSGTTAHTAVTAYVVAKFPNVSQGNNNVLIETQASSKAVQVRLNFGASLSWIAGDGATNIVTTPDSAIEINVPSVWSFSKSDINTPSGNKQDIRKNGVVLAANNATGSFTGNYSDFNLGNFGQVPTANIAEVIYMLDSNLTSSAQRTIESYLATKYGTTLGNTTTPSDYIASDSSTVYWTANARFQKSVFGIGTDSVSGLVQKMSNSVISGSGDGTGQSGKGNLVLSTTTDLRDKRFLMIGTSGAALDQITISSGTLQNSTRIRRNWKVQNTNAVGAVTLSFDTTGLTQQAGGAQVTKYALLISSVGDTTYPNGSQTFTATSAAGKKLVFAGVTLPNNAVFTIITNNFNVALPAVWLGFTADAVNGNGILNWKTSDELNVDNYSIEHSYNGISFSSVGSMVANNYTGVNTYAFTDNGLSSGVHYYRIRRTDKDGKYAYSDIKSIKITVSGANVQVRPNPVTGPTLVLAVALPQSNKTNIAVMGVDGKIIVQENVSLGAGNNLVNINIATVPPGIYLVRVQLSDEVVTRKFIKER